MRPELYQQYLSLKNMRRKQEAEEALNGFLGSFQSDQEREQWVRDFLGTHDDKEKISYVLYAPLVFPVLRAGYERNDAWSTFWLARTADNIAENKELHMAIGGKGKTDLLREAYVLEPSSEIRRHLLENNIQWFRYYQHEWPSGILYDFGKGATAEQCDEILQDVVFTRRLDESGEFQMFLTDFEGKVREYGDGLAAAKKTSDTIPAIDGVSENRV